LYTDKQSPSRTPILTERLLPSELKSETEALSPNLENDSIERVSPSRLKPARERLLPITTWLNIEDSPAEHSEKTDNRLPHLRPAETDKLLPKSDESKADNEC
jgi:hypothetical protein